MGHFAMAIFAPNERLPSSAILLTSIDDTLLLTRPDQTRKEEELVQPVFCIVDTGSCSL